MKILSFLTDKILKLYVVEFIIKNNCIIIGIILSYLFKTKTIKVKSKKLWNKFYSVFNKFWDPENEYEKKNDDEELKKEKNYKELNDECCDKLNDECLDESNNNIELTIKKSKDNEIKKSIVKKCNILKKTCDDPYKNDIDNLDKKYKNDPENHEFKLDINSNICSTLIFTMRTFECIDFYYNFLVHNFTPQQIYNLNMCKDVSQWMSSSYLSNNDLQDEFVPIYFIYKETEKGEVQIYEYLKCFISTNIEGVKCAFIQKGCDFLGIKNYIDILINEGLIKNLLKTENYINYNLSTNEGTVSFLENFLSLVLISEDKLGLEITFDLSNYYETKNVYEYYMKTCTSDINLFNTSI
jgi:hypothetical protein